VQPDDIRVRMKSIQKDSRNSSELLRPQIIIHPAHRPPNLIGRPDCPAQIKANDAGAPPATAFYVPIQWVDCEIMQLNKPVIKLNRSSL
jgi:hypothetical protein